MYLFKSTTFLFKLHDPDATVLNNSKRACAIEKNYITV